MSDRFQDKYRIPSARLRNWDYGSDATYFVTICTQGRECFFGEIINYGNDATHHDINVTHDGRDAMHRVSTLNRVFTSAIGKIVETEWLKTPEIRPDMNLKWVNLW